MAADTILAAIGNTPLVRLRALAPANGAEIWVKLDYPNPTGSMKDRLAELATEPGSYATDQFNNPYAVPGHRDMLGREVWEQTATAASST